jgi:signal peptidase I
MQAAPEFQRLARRATFAIATLLAAVSSVAGIKSERQLAAIITHTPAPRIVQDGQQMKQAEQVAAGIPGAQTFWGIGHSMEPLYAPNTAIVVKPATYDEIKKGMTVVYQKRNGRVVAHSVVGEDGKGYIVQGVNNDEEDAESVNESNLIGVVVAAFAPADSSFRIELAKQLVAKGRVSREVAHI